MLELFNDLKFSKKTETRACLSFHQDSVFSQIEPDLTMVNVSIFRRSWNRYIWKWKKIRFFRVHRQMMRKPKINLPKEWENATSVFSEDFFQLSNWTKDAWEDAKKGLPNNCSQYFWFRRLEFLEAVSWMKRSFLSMKFLDFLFHSATHLRKVFYHLFSQHFSIPFFTVFVEMFLFNCWINIARRK